MGSPEGQGDDGERPQHDVTIAKPFAVAKFALTFDEWDACAAHGDCSAAYQRQRMGPRPAAGDQRELGRCADLREMALQDHRQGPIGCSPRPSTRCGARRN